MLDNRPKEKTNTFPRSIPIDQENSSLSNKSIIHPPSPKSNPTENTDIPLHTMTMTELYETIFPPKPPIIENLLHRGTYLFVGAPKIGKSFMMAQIAYHVSQGIPLWDYPVRKGKVLYLALEDDYSRLQQRLYRMFGAESTDNLHFSVCSKHLGDGLDTQLEAFMMEFADTSLIIIDTLQMIREQGGERYSYSSDYDIIAKIKLFSAQNGLCILLVHHTRKQGSEDCFDTISGTNGLLGAADGAFILKKDQRTSNEALLDISGRDQQDQRLYLEFDRERCIWSLTKVEKDFEEAPADPILAAVAALLSQDSPEWRGTATELLTELRETGIQPNVLTRRLNIGASCLLDQHGIRYAKIRSHSGRHIALRLAEP